jgi:hypothetical protein
MANLSAEPAQLKGARRCGAKTRGARGGRPCRSPAMPNGRFRMHGGRAGGPTGSANGAYRTGRFTKQTREVSRAFRQMAKTGEQLAATAMRAHGLPVPKRLRRRAHVKKAVKAFDAAKAAQKAKEGTE